MVCIGKEFNSQRTGLGQQHDRHRTLFLTNDEVELLGSF